MTYAQLFKGLDQAEKDRRFGAIVKMNILWDKRNACQNADERKRIDKKIDTIRRKETQWLRNAAWFLY